MREICDSCVLKIVKAVQFIANVEVEIGASVETECEFIDDVTGQKFTVLLKLNNHGMPAKNETKH